MSQKAEEQLLNDKVSEYDRILTGKNSMFNVEQLEEAMQKVMDTYAGGM